MSEATALDLSAGDVVRTAGRYPLAVFGTPILFAMIGVATALLSEESFTSEASFLSSSGSSGGGQIAGLASQFGLSLGGTGDGAASPQLYVEVVQSRRVLESTLTRQYDHANGRRTLLDILEVEGDTERQRLDAGYEELRDLVSANGNLETGLVTVEVEMPDAALAEAVLQAIVEGIDDFNVDRRQSEAAAERVFVEGELARARQELEVAEDALLAFQESNRQAVLPPSLSLEQSRLSRRVDISQRVVLTLSEGLEQARIEEVRNTPVFTMLDPPFVPGEPDGRGTVLRALLGLIVGGVFGAGGVLFLEFRRLRANELAFEWKRGREASANPLETTEAP